MKNDNLELIKRCRDGDEQALEELIQNNLALVRNLVYRFADRGIELEDLMQIGTIGMIKAVKSFDFSFGTAFSTYAVPLIIGEVRRYLRDDGIIKVSRDTKKMGIMILKKKEEFQKKNGRDPKISELSELCELPSDEIIFALEAVSPVRSLSDPVTAGDDQLTLEGIVCEKENSIDTAIDRIALREAISTLPPLQREIISLRYYKDLSQQQTGNILGISQVKVSREEKKIISALRKVL